MIGRHIVDRGALIAATLGVWSCSACGHETPEPSSPASSSQSSSSAGGGAIVADCKDGWCRIPSGRFMMGSPATEWGHPARAEDQVEVTITRSFLIRQHEITQEEWTAQGFENPSGLMANGTGDCPEPKCPVGNVTWFDAAAFANRLSKAGGLPTCYDLSSCDTRVRHGLVCVTMTLTTPKLYDCKGYRLPTEAEWEYAVRAGTTTAFYSGDITKYSAESDCHPDTNLERIAWYCSNAGPTTHPGGQKDANAWGLYDMCGNAYEWVHDEYTPEGYGDEPLTDPGGDLVQNDLRVMRGGSFNIWSTSCRSADRSGASYSARSPGLGFRLVRTLPAGE
jgi:formylglycine-generating enzyme required for sulfatase activity